MGTKKTVVHNQEEENLDLQDSKFTIFAKKFYRKHVKGISPMRQILIWYFLITLLGTLFLMTPWVLKGHDTINYFIDNPPPKFYRLPNILFETTRGAEIKNHLLDPLARPGFLDSLFMASSAFSDTGLTTVGVSFTYNWFGQLVLLLLIEVGGIGWFALKIFILLFFIRKLKYSTISQSSYEKGLIDNKLAIGVIKTAVIITIGSTILFGIIFGVMFATIEPLNILENATFYKEIGSNDLALIYSGPAFESDAFIVNIQQIISDPYFFSNWSLVPIDGAGLYNNWLDAFRVGFFHAGASINNSGLDIFVGGYSLAAYYGNYGIQTLTIMLFILGGIGFSVIYDLYQYIINKSTGQKFRFSLITKISVVSYALIAFGGLAFVFLIEGVSTINDSTAFLANSNYGTGFQRSFALVFNTFSTRNAGFSTIDISLFSSATQVSYILMMFIGSGPGSTAGGLRTTTFFVIVMSTWAQIHGKKHTNAFKRTISNKQCLQARNTFIFSLMLILVGTMIVFSAEDVSGSFQISGATRNDYSGFLYSLFVVTSAFGTTGLSPVSLSEITIISKLVIILIMFLGKVGMSTTIEQFSSKKPIDRHYLEEYVNLG